MRFIRFGICLLLAFAILAHGAVEVWAESIVEIGAAFLFVLWSIVLYRDPEIEIKWQPLNWPLLGIIVIGAAQLIFHGTISPYLTWAELLRVTAYFLLLFLCTQVFREKAELRMLVWFLVVFGFLAGLFAIIQFFTSNGKLYWIRELAAGGAPYGPYVNRNHFAGFMELVAPLGLSLLVLRGTRREQVPLVGLFVMVSVGSLFLSASRGGITVFLCELVLLAGMAWVGRSGNMRLGAVALVLLAACALIAWLGVGEVMQRFAQVRSGEVTSSRRVGIVKDSWRIFRDHPWKGTGLGTFVAAFPKYESYYDGKVVDHAHNDYVETISDLGIPGAICGLAFLIILIGRALSKILARQSSFSLAFHIGAFVACCGLLVHGLVDFNLHIPANAFLFFVQAFLATAPVLESTVSQGSRGHSRSSRSRSVEFAMEE
jgi:O-antigen ligase